MTAPELTIRPFRTRDLPAMQQVRMAAFHPVFESFREIVGARIAALAFVDADGEQARLLEAICGDRRRHHVLVAAIGREVVGFVSFSLDVRTRIGEIGLNAVHPDHAGRGIGTRLYECAMARMKARGMAVATVGTGGDPSHAAARRAYGKAGFGPGVPSVQLYRLL
jgi:ribosomal protein S18 acetylase RimI-like enzyme